MEKFITATGKTIDLAIAAALEELHMDRDSVSVEVLENPRSGFLGIGAQPARVKVTYEAPDEAPKPALSSASRSKPKKPAESKPADGAKVIAPAAPKVIAPAAPEAPRPQDTRAAAPKAPQQPRQDRAPKQRGPRPERRDQKPRQPQQAEKPAVPAEPKVYAPAEPGSREERIEIFIKGLLEHMGSDAVPHAVNTGDDTYLVDLVGENLGILIGRRGETLDAIQQLTSYSVNRTGSRVRVQLDAENYRAKREQSLERLANKVAGKVVKYRRSVTLEPMNAYERHVIHTALQEVPGVTTYSTGVDPNRRVIVAYDREKK